MNITAFAIKNNRITICFLLCIILAGTSSFSKMSRDDMPPFLVRVATVVTNFPGANPERVELLVSDKIEKVLQEMPQIDYIESESRTGVSIITIAIKDSESNLRPIFDEIRRNVNSMKGQLPEGTNPVVDDNLGDTFGILLGLTGEGYTAKELNIVADEMRDELIRLENAAKVVIRGKQDERVYLEFNEDRLAELGLSKENIKNLISSTNILFSGGNITVNNETIILEPTGNFNKLEDIKNILIKPKGSQQIIALKDIMNIHQAYAEPKGSIVRIKGEEGLILGISLKKGGNIIDLGKLVDQKIEHFNAIYPHGIEIQRSASQDYVVDKSVKDFIGNLLQSITVVLLVMLVFLGLRTGLVVATLIPATMTATIFMMNYFDVGLNQVSLAALIIALGMLVDNAIVVSESILVQLEKGEKPFDAAVNASKELMIPLLVSSLTTSAAFLSFFLAESTMGEIMGQIFVVVTIALLSSWVLSLTVVAMLAMYFIKVPNKESAKSKISIFDYLQKIYKKVLLFNLKLPVLIFIFIFVGLYLSFVGLGRLPFVFFPDSSRALVTVNLELPLGSTINRTEATVKKIESFIDKELLSKENKEGVLKYSSFIGVGAPKYDLGYTPPKASPFAAHLMLNTSSGKANGPVIKSLDTYLFNNFPDLSFRVARLSGGGGSANPIEIRIKGKDPKILDKIVSNTKLELSQAPGIKSIADSWGMRAKKFIIQIDQSKAKLADITGKDIATSLKTSLSGEWTGDYREGDKVIPIIMRNQSSEISGIERLETLNIFSQNSGANVPLSSVANIELTWENAKIIRRDLFKTITITADLKSGFTASAALAHMRPILEKRKESWQNGYQYSFGGEAENSSKNMGAITKYLPLSFFIIVILLVGQFNSIRKTIIVLATVPLGLIGVIGGLFITGSSFGFMAFLGLISLAGIVINNAIVLLDRIQIEIDELNKTPYDAIIDAASQRFRPILLTTATTALGLIPLWISGGEMWEPMAIGIIFGLLFATIITLLFVPILYKLLYRAKDLTKQ